jgi:hypothetical protein
MIVLVDRFFGQAGQLRRRDWLDQARIVVFDAAHRGLTGQQIMSSEG